MLWLTSSETGGGPHQENKGEIAIYKTFIFHRRVSLNSHTQPTQHQYKTHDGRLGIVGLNQSTKFHQGHNSKSYVLVLLSHKVFMCRNLLIKDDRRRTRNLFMCYELAEKLTDPSADLYIL